jgi:hypothetical protein
MLAGALAVLGEVVRLATQCAAETEAVTRAQLMAASKLAELASQITPLEAVQNSPFPDDPEWVYSIAIAPTEQPGVIAVQVDVAQATATTPQPVSCALVRWMLDPAFVADEPLSTEDSQGSGSTGSAR